MYLNEKEIDLLLEGIKEMAEELGQQRYDSDIEWGELKNEDNYKTERIIKEFFGELLEK